MLSDVIVEDIVGLCTCAYKKAMVYYCFCCGMYEELFTKNCDNVVSCIKTLSLCRVPCVSVPPILSYINMYMYYSIVFCCGMYEDYCLPTNCDNA